MIQELTPEMTSPEARATQNANNGYLSEQLIPDHIASQSTAEAGTNNTDIMTALRVFQQLSVKSAAITPAPADITGNGTATCSITVPVGSNPNRLTLLLSAATSATSAIRLRVGTGTYYPLIWPKPGTVVNVSSLQANTPYDLIFNGSAWIVKDYVEYGVSGDNYWTKYADGTMRQRGKKTETFGITTSLATNNFFSGDKTITLPVAFSDSNYIGGVTLSTSESEGAGAQYRTRTGADAKNIILYSFWSHQSVSPRLFVVYWWAEGRWY